MQKIAYIFPGQGSQYVGMGKELCSKSQIANKIFDEANQILNYDLKTLCFYGPENKLRLTEFAQPAILTLSVAVYYTLKNLYSETPEFMSGHSLGEITALVCSESISFSEGLKLVQKRGQIMGRVTKNIDFAMYAVNNLDSNIIEKEVKSSPNVSISNFNSPKQTVLCGGKKEVLELVTLFENNGGTCISLNVSAPFHSKYMKPAADQLLTHLRNITFNKPSSMILSNYTGKLYSENIVNLLYNQIFMPVQWNNCIDYLINAGVSLIIELGPKQILTNLINVSHQMVKAMACENYDDIINVSNILHEHEKETQTDIKEKELSILAKCLSISVCTPNRNFNNYEYEKGVIEPYSKLNKMYDNHEVENRILVKFDYIEALKLLKCILNTKKVTNDELLFRVSQLIDTPHICNVISLDEINDIMLNNQ